ncbi:MAG: hypothetical protein WBC44_14230 [Planctomycetaceae bacterium]
MRMKPLLSLAATLALAFAAGQVFSSTGDQTDAHAEPLQIAEQFAACVAEDRFDDLKMTMWKCAVDESVVGPLGDQLTLPYKRLCENLGTRTKVELLKTEVAGPSIVRYSFAELHTKGAVVWQFEFIKPKDEWKLHAYGFGPLRMDTASPGPFTTMNR